MRKAAVIMLLTFVGVLLTLALAGCMGGGGYIRGDGIATDDPALGGYCQREPTSPLCTGRATKPTKEAAAP